MNKNPRGLIEYLYQKNFKQESKSPQNKNLILTKRTNDLTCQIIFLCNFGENEIQYTDLIFWLNKNGQKSWNSMYGSPYDENAKIIRKMLRCS